MIKKLLSIKLIFFVLLFSSFSGNAQQAALDFDGTDDYILSDYTGVTNNNNRTIEAWIKAGASTSERFIVDMGTTNTGERFSLKINPSENNIRIEIGGGGITGNENITDSQWHHIAVTYDKDAVENKYKLYVDGTLDVSGDITTALNTPAEGTVTIGCKNDLDPSTSFNGEIDDVRIWSTVRSEIQIQENMMQGPCGTPTGLKVYYTFNEGTPEEDNSSFTTVTDYSANGFDGTLTNFSLLGNSSNFTEGVEVIEAANIDNTISIIDNALVANQEGATYQWIDCFAIDPYIEGETNQTFVPEENGSYAVQINMGTCQEFSECIDFEVSCQKPTEITLLGISDDNVTVLWSEIGNAQEWNIRYGAPGFNPYNAGTNITTTNPDKIELINGLTPSTSYDIYVQSVCGGEDGSSAWGGPINFTTIPISCFSPENIILNNITTTSVDISWIETGDAFQWNILYGVVGFNPENEGEIITVDSNPFTILNLESDLSYDIYVQASCGENDSSNWTGPKTITTNMLNVASQDFKDFSFYPNPVKDKLMLTAAKNIQQASIYNLLGQKIIETNPNQLNTQISTVSLSAGAYLIKVTIDGNNKVFKLIKE